MPLTITLALSLSSPAPQIPDLTREFLTAPWTHSSPQVLDFDGDGSKDILYFGDEPQSPGKRVIVHWGTGMGDFGGRTELQLDMDVYANGVVHDYDGDGDDDLVVQQEDTFDLFVLVNDGGRVAPAVVPFAQPGATRSGFELIDFDGDGDQDLVAARGPSGTFFNEYWYLERLGATTFGSAVSIFPSGELSPSAIYPDLDGDGDFDAVTVDRVNNRMRFYQWENTGSFPLGSRTLIEIGPQFEFAYRLFEHDVDGDGDSDVVFDSSISVSDSVGMFRNQGGVLSLREQVVSTPEGARNIELRDTTGTGARDLVLHDFDGRIVVLPDQGGGTYTSFTTVVDGYSTGSGSVLDDVDGDGEVDLVRLVTDDGPSFFPFNAVLLNRNAGLPGVPFAFGPPERLEEPLSEPEGIDVADFTGDGYPDVVVAAHGGTNLAVFPNDGAGGFEPMRVLTIGIPFALEVTHGDLDGDGDRDIVLNSWDRLDWFENSGDGSAWTRRLIYTNFNRDGFSVAAVDMDGDGDLDVLRASERISNDQNRISLFENDGSGGFTGPNNIVLPPAPQQIRCFEAADFDGNGTIDLVFAANESTVARLAWAPQLVGGGFGAIVELDAWAISSSSQSGYWDVLAQDIDGDGDVDVIGSAVSQPSRLALFTNDGTGAFAVTDIDSFTGSTGTLDIELVDVDLDGIRDLAATARPIGTDFASELVVYPGLGGGSFGAPESTNSGTDFAPHLRTGDFDQDGDPDFASVYWAYDRVSVYRNQLIDVVSEPYCGPGVPNSTGRGANLVVAGSSTLNDNAATLRAFNLPQFSAGFFIVSRTAGLNTMVPNSVGTLCLAGTIGRYAAPMQIQNSGEAGMFSLPIDLNAIPQATGFASVMAGEDWRFQAWYRDSSPNGPTSNFTDGVRASWE